MGRLIRISIYAFIILILYFWITSMINAYNSKQSKNTSDLNTLDSDIISEKIDTLTFEQESKEKPLSNTQIVDYDNIDKTVEKLKETDTSVHPSDKEQSQTKAISKKSPENKTLSPNSINTNTQGMSVNKGDGGSHVVICGSYLLKENADKMVVKLKKLGYTNAKVVIFNESGYHSTVAGLYSYADEAQKAKAFIKTKGIDCFVRHN